MASAQPRVLVMWSNPSAANLGVRALAEGTADLLRRVLGENILIDFPVFENEPLRRLLSTRALMTGLLTTSGSLREHLCSYDFLVETGAGDSFTDIYGLPRLARMFHIHRIAKRSGVPVVLGPQTIGPFESLPGRVMARRMLRSAQVVIARETLSAEHAERLGRTPDAIATDVVFSLREPARVRGRDIVLNVSGLLWGRNPHVDHRRYQAAVRALLRGVLAAGREVTIMPHVLDNPSVDNDVPVGHALAKEFPSLELRVPDSLDEAREVLGSAGLVIGARMHACLNALSAGTPAFPWAYSRKFLPLMNDLGWHSGLDLRIDADPASSTLEYLGTRDAALERVSVERLRNRARSRLDSAIEAIRAGLSERVTW